MNRRAEILHAFVKGEPVGNSLLEELRAFGWDWHEEEPLALVAKSDLLRIIDMFLSDQISADQLERWAEFLEVREDVDFDSHQRDLLRDVFFRIANPIVHEPLTKDSVRGMRNELEPLRV
jgi:hypothetical protein